MHGAGRKLTIRMPDNPRLRGASVARLHVDPGSRVSAGSPVLSLAIRNREHMVRAPRPGQVIPLVAPDDHMVPGDPLYILNIDQKALVEANGTGRALVPAEKAIWSKGITPDLIEPIVRNRSRRSRSRLGRIAETWGKPGLAIVLYVLACFSVLPALGIFGQQADWPVVAGLIAGSVLFAGMIIYLCVPRTGLLARWTVRLVAASWLGVSMLAVFGPQQTGDALTFTDTRERLVNWLAPPDLMPDLMPEPEAGVLVTPKSGPESADSEGGAEGGVEGSAREAAKHSEIKHSEIMGTNSTKTDSTDGQPADIDATAPALPAAAPMDEGSATASVTTSSATTTSATAARPASLDAPASSGLQRGGPLGPAKSGLCLPQSNLGEAPDLTVPPIVRVRAWARVPPPYAAAGPLGTPREEPAPRPGAALVLVVPSPSPTLLSGPVQAVQQIAIAYGPALDPPGRKAHALIGKEVARAPLPALAPAIGAAMSRHPQLGWVLPDLVSSLPPAAAVPPSIARLQTGTSAVPALLGNLKPVPELSAPSRPPDHPAIQAVAPGTANVVAPLLPATVVEPAALSPAGGARRHWLATRRVPMLVGTWLQAMPDTNLRLQRGVSAAPPRFASLSFSRSQGREPDPVAFRSVRPGADAWMMAWAQTPGAAVPPPDRAGAELPVRTERVAALLSGEGAAGLGLPAIMVAPGLALAIPGADAATARNPVDTRSPSDWAPASLAPMPARPEPGVLAGFGPTAPAARLPRITLPVPAFADRLVLFLYHDDPRAPAHPEVGDSWSPDLPPDLANAIRAAKVEAVREVVQVAAWCEGTTDPAWLNDRIRLLQVRLSVEPAALGRLEAEMPVFGDAPPGFFHNRLPLLGGDGAAPVMARGWNYLRAAGGGDVTYFDDPDAVADSLAARGCTAAAWESEGPANEIGRVVAAKLAE